MIYKGIVVKIKRDFAVVYTDQEEFLEIKSKNGLMIGKKILFTEDDILKNNIKSTDWKERINMSKKYLAIAASLVVLVTAGIFGYKFLIPESNIESDPGPVLSMLSDEATSVVTIDINPSIELFLDENNLVLEIKALNDDAETLDLSQFVGMTAEDAVEGIVILASEAGFINQEDLTEDYVLLTIADINEDDTDDLTPLETRLQTRISESDQLQSLNMAIMKTTRAEILEAEGENVPIGLYVINGMIESDGEMITVKEFFSNPNNQAAFLQKGNLVQMTEEKKIQLAEKFMAQMENVGTDVTALRAMLGDPNMNIEQVMSQVRTTYENSGEVTGGNSDNSNNDTGNNQEATTTNQNQQSETATSAGNPGGAPQVNR